MSTIFLDTCLPKTTRGDIVYQELDANTGQVLREIHEPNLVVDTHMDIFMARIYEDNPDYRVRKARIGSDVGSGFKQDPELPTKETVAGDMNVLYETENNVSVDYPNTRTITYNIFLNGEDIMNNFPGEDSIEFTSMALVTMNDHAFSYRRFPSRTITEAININIMWTLYFDGEWSP